MLSDSSSERINVKQRSESLSKQFVNNYQSIFTEIVDESLSRISYIDSNEIKDRIKKMAGYYTLEKKPILGELFLYAYELLQDEEDYSDINIHQAYVVACGLEMSNSLINIRGIWYIRVPLINALIINYTKGASYYLFVDDMEDEGKTRYGKPCWHLLPDVGPLTWNDSSMLRSFIHELLSQNLPQDICFRITEYINKVYFLSTIGQHMDVTLSEKRNYKNFTMNQYRTMSELKIFAIQAPIILALILTNKLTDDSTRQAESVWKDISVFIQAKNDVMDLNVCDNFKSSTDIQKGKCSWLAVKALEMCDDEQSRIFEENYGNPDEVSVRKIRELYDKLQLRKIYKEAMQEQYENYLRKINDLPSNAVPSADVYRKLFCFLEKIELS